MKYLDEVRKYLSSRKILGDEEATKLLAAIDGFYGFDLPTNDRLSEAVAQVVEQAHILMKQSSEDRGDARKRMKQTIELVQKIRNMRGQFLERTLYNADENSTRMMEILERTNLELARHVLGVNLDQEIPKA